MDSSKKGICVTQPRRVAAMSVAKRVAEEMVSFYLNNKAVSLNRMLFWEKKSGITSDLRI